jgi:hypothetical protein
VLVGLLQAVLRLRDRVQRDAVTLQDARVAGVDLAEQVRGLRDVDVLRASEVSDQAHVVHRLGHRAGGAHQVRERVLEILVVDPGELGVLLDDRVDLFRVRAIGDPGRLELRLQPGG